jgi:hypothetical protein
MPYSNSLTDTEWKIIEPLLPQQKQIRPPLWSKRQIQLWHLLPAQKWLQLVRFTLHIYLLTQPYSGTTNSGEKMEF